MIVITGKWRISCFGSSMTSSHKREVTVFALAIALSRFCFRSRQLYDLDSVNFALGMVHFDPSVHQPHPPGYFLYVLCGRLLAQPLHDANLALVLLSVAASCGTLLFIYLLALEWFGASAARFASLVFLLSPLAWFHGTVALTYIIETFFSSLLGYLCWQVFRDRHQWAPVAGFILGVAAGVRPSSVVLLAPLVVFSTHKVPHRQKVIVLAVVLLTVAAWCAPMLAASGGPTAYFEALNSLWRSVPGQKTAFNSSPVNAVARGITIAFIYLLTFGAASLGHFAASRSRGKAGSGQLLFTAIWVAPALGFFTLIFLKFVNSGYLLLLAPPGCVWLGLWISEWYAGARMSVVGKRAMIAGGALINIMIFLFSPLYCSYRSVRKSEAELSTVDRATSKTFDPADTLIVAFDSHFMGFRHAGYTLPQYLTVEYPEVHVGDEPRIFGMRGRATSILPKLPLSSYKRFVFFPLPQGNPAYSRYLDEVEKKLPSGVLTVSQVDGVTLVTGPISCLVRLFPKTAEATSEGCVSRVSVEERAVYDRAHSGGRDR
ncbi:MAG: hypothetical protein JWP08_4070 [Bryobacterales bacterium]|nr:hypothetical protein [Bryobacterales bacterium]